MATQEFITKKTSKRRAGLKTANWPEILIWVPLSSNTGMRTYLRLLNNNWHPKNRSRASWYRRVNLRNLSIIRGTNRNRSWQAPSWELTTRSLTLSNLRRSIRDLRGQHLASPRWLRSNLLVSTWRRYRIPKWAKFHNKVIKRQSRIYHLLTELGL